jgi:hypothetical protein
MRFPRVDRCDRRRNKWGPEYMSRPNNHSRPPEFNRETKLSLMELYDLVRAYCGPGSESKFRPAKGSVFGSAGVARGLSRFCVPAKWDCPPDCGSTPPSATRRESWVSMYDGTKSHPAEPGAARWFAAAVNQRADAASWSPVESTLHRRNDRRTAERASTPRS